MAQAIRRPEICGQATTANVGTKQHLQRMLDGIDEHAMVLEIMVQDALDAALLDRDHWYEVIEIREALGHLRRFTQRMPRAV